MDRPTKDVLTNVWRDLQDIQLELIEGNIKIKELRRQIEELFRSQKAAGENKENAERDVLQPLATEDDARAAAAGAEVRQVRPVPEVQQPQDEGGGGR